MGVKSQHELLFRTNYYLADMTKVLKLYMILIIKKLMIYHNFPYQKPLENKKGQSKFSLLFALLI